MSKEAAEPMDPSVQEVARGEVATNNKRIAYAVQTLIKEVTDAFPDVIHEVSNYDGRNTATDVSFVYDDSDAELVTLLALVKSDERVKEVLDDGEGTVLVSFHANPRIQDKRDPFDLADAWEVLSEGTDGGTASDTSSDEMDGGGA